jgi:hypothetical protein
MIGSVLIAMKSIQVWRNKEFDLRRALGVSMICIIFLFHPTITIQSLNVFQCKQVDEGDIRMTKHMEFKWYSADHMMWAALIGLPNLAIWVIGCPLFALFVIIQHRNNLDDWKIKKYFLILYQGLKPKIFYWEFFNTFRKFTILLLSLMMDSLSISYKIFTVVSKPLLTHSCNGNHHQNTDALEAL